MEEEWRVYLKENAPELYKQMLNSIKHQANWRDRQIEQLQAELDRSKPLLDAAKVVASEDFLEALSRYQNIGITADKTNGIERLVKAVSEYKEE